MQAIVVITVASHTKLINSAWCLLVSQAPPRPAEDSTQQIEMSGYSAARSDFAVEHNNFAELDIRDITLTETGGSLDAGMVQYFLLLI